MSDVDGRPVGANEVGHVAAPISHHVLHQATSALTQPRSSLLWPIPQWVQLVASWVGTSSLLSILQRLHSNRPPCRCWALAFVATPPPLILRVLSLLSDSCDSCRCLARQGFRQSTTLLLFPILLMRKPPVSPETPHFSSQFPRCPASSGQHPEISSPPGLPHSPWPLFVLAQVSWF